MNHYITEGTTLAEAQAIRQRAMQVYSEYSKIVDDLFSGVFVESIPWEDEKFRRLFYSRIGKIHAMQEKARHWDAITALAAAIGNGARS